MPGARKRREKKERRNKSTSSRQTGLGTDAMKSRLSYDNDISSQTTEPFSESITQFPVSAVETEIPKQEENTSVVCLQFQWGKCNYNGRQCRRGLHMKLPLLKEEFLIWRT